MYACLYDSCLSCCHDKCVVKMKVVSESGCSEVGCGEIPPCIPCARNDLVKVNIFIEASPLITPQAQPVHRKQLRMTQ